MREAGIDPNGSVQDSLSRSAYGVLRCLHVRSSQGEAKLARLLWSRLRRHRGLAPGVTSLNWPTIEFRDSEQLSIYVPTGCGHGIQALTGPADASYRIDREHDPAEDVTIAHNDPQA
jgi:dTDP-4-dehydrorhamnose 3,5-epimerase